MQLLEDFGCGWESPVVAKFQGFFDESLESRSKKEASSHFVSFEKMRTSHQNTSWGNYFNISAMIPDRKY